MGVRFGINGVSEMKKLADTYRKNYSDDNIKVFLTRLAKVGIDVAKVKFATTYYDGDTSDLIVSDRPHFVSPTEMLVKASGSSILFIEFGSGIYFSQPYPIEKPKGILGIGEYGKGLGNNDYWFFTKESGKSGTVSMTNPNAIITHGNQPAKAMYFACREMQDNIEKIASEVFSYDNG